MRARTGKIARLPLAIREELNRRLLENEPASKILPWLNALPEMKSIIAEMGEAGGHQVGPCDDRNLSDWRNGGHADWVRRRDRMEGTKELAGYAVGLAKAGKGSISEGAAAIAAGKVLELLEAATEEGATPETLKGLVGMVSELRAGDQGQTRFDLERLKLTQNEESLRQGREKIELLKLKACEAMLSAAVRRKAEEISNSNLSNAEKIAAMRKAAFADVDELEASGDVKLPE
jgi:hypothetical protein